MMFELVGNVLPCADHIVVAGLFAVHIGGEERFGIIGETFMDPHIRGVLVGDAVSEPFVAAFVDDDEIPFQAPAGAGEVAAEVAVLEPVAVGDVALVLHSQVGRFDQLIAVFVERVGARTSIQRHPAWYRPV